MKLTIRKIFALGLMCFLFIAITYNLQMDRDLKKNAYMRPAPDPNNDYALATKFLNQLKNKNPDTIIYYQRTCIGCCDFFNIFWSSNGQRYLVKFYFDFKTKKVHTDTVILTKDKIFEVLGQNFTLLKKTSIKGNAHKNKDGTTTLNIVDHYCYTKMSIYAAGDSIITDQMTDHAFDKYTDFHYEFDSSYKNKERQKNDSYSENINSKWNLFLTTVESEIASMAETSCDELNNLRTWKTK